MKTLYISAAAWAHRLTHLKGRVPRLLQLSYTVASEAILDSGVIKPDAIIVGTGYGSPAKTQEFLTQLITSGESCMSPTSFIYATANSVAGYLALAFSVTGPNQTFVHSGHAFESALLDSWMLLQENDLAHILVGGVDEKTPLTTGATGEGAAFFIVSAKAADHQLATITDFETFYLPADIGLEITKFLAGRVVDVVLSGADVDFFPGLEVINFKEICGEFPVATAFALWYATTLPQRSVLICNCYDKKHWTIMFVVNQC